MLYLFFSPLNSRNTMSKENLTPRANTTALIMKTTVKFINTDGKHKEVTFPNSKAAAAFCVNNNLLT